MTKAALIDHYIKAWNDQKQSYDNFNAKIAEMKAKIRSDKSLGKDFIALNSQRIKLEGLSNQAFGSMSIYHGFIKELNELE